ncbi:MAG: hypothetical protein MI924_10200 [Chloroflexales bacterium]|nr:hypothetical protein [Chloroflexales bacterium]
MIETAIKANTAEANRLYLRGLAAARGGQRRIAAGLLTRSVQLDPQNEQAWLWLSGVLDDPHHVAFCLRAVLKINPVNERAQQGLAWLEQRQLLNGAPQPALVLEINLDEPSLPDEKHTQHESWWVNWRQARREINRVRLIIWSIPIVLVSLALVLYQTFAIATEASSSDSTPFAISSAMQLEMPGSAIEPILEPEPASIRESLTVGYLSALEPLREQLRNAVDSYLNATDQPGGESVNRTMAAQRLHDSVRQAHATMEQLKPPQDLQAAHDEYLKGLELEMEALNDLMEFYTTYEVQLANRAALNFQQASNHINQAKIAFEAQRQYMSEVTSVSPHSVR